MSISLNVNTPKINSLHRSGPTPIAIPEAKSSQTGVSVEYAPDATKQWFVFRASYGREDIVGNALIEAGYYAYVAKRYKWRETEGRRKRVLESLIPNIVFAHITARDAEILTKDADPLHPSPCPQLSPIISYYYNHFAVNEFGRNVPLVVEQAEMENFILGTCTHNENLLLLQKNDYHFRSDEEVRITQGEFKGVCGKVIKAKGQQRVLIRLTNLGNIGTAYIPSAFLESIA